MIEAVLPYKENNGLNLYSHSREDTGMDRIKTHYIEV